MYYCACIYTTAGESCFTVKEEEEGNVLSSVYIRVGYLL